MFEYARFMHVLVTHHLHGGDEMEGRAPDADELSDDATTVRPLLHSCTPQFVVDLGRDRDVVERRLSFRP